MTELVPVVADENRQKALLRAVGLDRYAVEVQELAINIAQRYDLDLLLKHLVIIDGRPYITRDGLLHIAHRSGQFDGITATDPVLDADGNYWRATCSVYRRDMSHPFTYSGRYPAKGGSNVKYAPEMAVKVSECMSLRRAFDVAAPVFEERWDIDAEAYEASAAPAPTGRERLAQQAAVVRGEPMTKQLAPVIEEREREGRAPSTAEAEAEAMAMPTAEYLDFRAAAAADTEEDEDEETAIGAADASDGQEDATTALPVNEEKPSVLKLSKKDFQDRIIAATIALPDVARAAGRLFGSGRTVGSLSDEERGVLWAELTRSE